MGTGGSLAPALRRGRHHAAPCRSAGLAVLDLQGLRIFSDLVPASYIDSDADRAALLELEQTASRHPDYAFLGHIGAALHVRLARLTL